MRCSVMRSKNLCPRNPFGAGGYRVSIKRPWVITAFLPDAIFHCVLESQYICHATAHFSHLQRLLGCLLWFHWFHAFLVGKFGEWISHVDGASYLEIKNNSTTWREEWIALHWQKEMANGWMDSVSMVTNIVPNDLSFL
jgi:hypothetical protein